MSETNWSPANPERDAVSVSREVELERTLRDVARAVTAAWGKAYLGDRERKVFELLRPWEPETEVAGG